MTGFIQKFLNIVLLCSFLCFLYIGVKEVIEQKLTEADNNMVFWSLIVLFTALAADLIKQIKEENRKVGRLT